jgi:hypothetical protein
MATGDEDEGPSDGVVLLLEGVTLDEEIVLEENEDINGDRARRRRRGPRLVTEPEAMSNEAMNRLFLQLMGEQNITHVIAERRAAWVEVYGSEIQSQDHGTWRL